MDTLKVKKTRNLRQVSLVTVFLLVTIIIYMLWSGPSLAEKDLVFAKVQLGELTDEVSGYGQLQSASNRMMTAQYRATVVNILHKPGVKVEPDTIILKLENPELREELDSAQRSLNRHKGNIRQLILEQKSEKLFEDRKLVILVSELQAAEIELKALEKVADLGIVSNITFESKKLDRTRLSELIKLDKERLKQLTLLHEEAINIQLEFQAQLEADFHHLRMSYEKLNVTAGISGVLQSLHVELGQNIRAGELMAIIGVESDLLAEVRVSQSQAQFIAIGQEAIVDTRRDKIRGKVIRVDPIVENNTVAVDIELLDDLPESTRPFMNVESSIVVNKIDSALYIRKPSYARANTTMQLYKLKDGETVATLSTLRFGAEVGDKIQILSGAKAGETIIISDLTEMTKDKISL